MVSEMKFVSAFNPVNLPEDPISGQEGDIYYNTNYNEYRGFIAGQWRVFISEPNLKILIAPEIFTVGIGLSSASVVLEQFHSENVIYCMSASLTSIIIPEQSTTSIHTGSRMTIVRGSGGDVQIVKDTEDINFNPPSEIYLVAEGTTAVLMNVANNTWAIETEFPDIY